MRKRRSSKQGQKLEKKREKRKSLVVFLTFLPPRVPGTTCRVRIEVNLGISRRRASTVPSGSLAKASSEGAKMVNLSPFRVSTRPHALTAATRVCQCEEERVAVRRIRIVILANTRDVKVSGGVRE